MYLFRVIKIIRIIMHYGLDEFIPTFSGGRYLKKALSVCFFWRRFNDCAPIRLRLALEALGPIFVKFGQVLSTRRDLLPLALADELAKLQDQVAPFPAATAKERITQQLKKSPEQLFTRFDDLPIASASVAQVHYAELPNGRKVAVKILRPGIRLIIEQDLALMHLIAGWIEKIFADGKRLKLHEVIAEFDKHLHDELDLTHEAANASQLRRNFQGSTLLYIPEVFFDYCAKEVMVMEWIEGIAVSQIAQLIAANIDLKTLARQGVEIFFTQVFRDGFFHADMHPGNIFVGANGRYIAVDFGIVGSLTEFDKHYLAVNFLAFFNRDYKRVASAHLECGWVPKDTRIEELESAIRAVCEPVFNKPLADISFGQILLRLFETSRRFQVEIQPQLVLLQKTLLNIESLGRELDPALDLWQTAKPFLERWMSEQIGWRALLRNIRKEAPEWVSIIPSLPRRLHELAHLPYTELLIAGHHSFLRQQKKHNRLLLVITILFAISMIKTWW